MRNKAILPSDLIFRISRELKKQGKIVGLTHGAFDLFHVSHLDLLLKSAKQCDYLIVGVDSDESVSQYKTYLRPIISERARQELINELNCVDAVFIKSKDSFSINELTDLYKEIKPDFVSIGVKSFGEDKIRYTAERANIRPKKIETVQSYTTSKIIESIIGRHQESVKDKYKLTSRKQESKIPIVIKRGD